MRDAVLWGQRNDLVSKSGTQLPFGAEIRKSWQNTDAINVEKKKHEIYL